ncbi:hypothetical protein SDRG_03790 [Saprolegnia diclina VS20]|uniref:Uncharacterized protein n=1 Tax=Saprolegnia diclina (strain VS20) TaxID=1156394 RepID=T0S7T5_SAPDV|nr:hypothetical protein SDRG_03790 [Saprolegnia diclina VS20]EQC38832.1 hypothetical protein SDRG_03790 [Saprolegnia diclina VS20]|eukprot:XP_008607656.1 hypothetical protein SDRG_03790 [Saprolegnia diclina VS20]
MRWHLVAGVGGLLVYSLLWCQQLNSLLGTIQDKAVHHVSAAAHYARYQLYPSLEQVLPYAESFLFPTVVARHGTRYSCIKFQYTGMGSCPSQINDLVSYVYTPNKTEACDTVIQTGIYGVPGYCELRDDATNETIRTMYTSCGTLTGRQFSCALAAQYASYGHDASTFFYALNTSYVASRGIVFSVHPSALASAYASIAHLRALNCSLPIEVWHRPDELPRDNAILQALHTTLHVQVRPIFHPLATRFYSKIYAVLHSAFESVLLLDCDNFAIHDPAYLFSTPAFQSNGAIFWPDYWRPGHTCFNIDGYSQLWDLLGINFVDMFEQESGQVLLNKTMAEPALHVLAFFALYEPRFLTNFGMVYGDKDLFRLAWLKANVPFHMIGRPPGSLGKLDRVDRSFCGSTMVQHDPSGDVIFLHRNTVKLSGCRADAFVWETLQDFRFGDVHLARYLPAGYVLRDATCFGVREPSSDLYTMTTIRQSPFAHLEGTLYRFAREAMKLQHPNGCPADNANEDHVQFPLDLRGKRIPSMHFYRHKSPYAAEAP